MPKIFETADKLQGHQTNVKMWKRFCNNFRRIAGKEYHAHRFKRTDSHVNFRGMIGKQVKQTLNTTPINAG
jgi:hypothetical protein